MRPRPYNRGSLGYAKRFVRASPAAPSTQNRAKALRAGLIRSKPNRPESFRIFLNALLRLGLSGSGRASAHYSEHGLGFGFSMLFTLGAG